MFGKIFFASVLLLLLVPTVMMKPRVKGKCKIEKRVKVALKTLNRASVTEVANCILDVGECDAVGNEIKGEVKGAVCSKPCSRKTQCSCEQIQVWLILHGQLAEGFHELCAGQAHHEEDQGGVQRPI